MNDAVKDLPFLFIAAFKIMSVGSCRKPVSNQELEKDGVEDVLEVQNLIKDLVHFLSL